MGFFRFFLSLAVLIAHAGPVFGHYVADGRFAVQMFYLVSGFYMALVWSGRYANSHNVIRTFYLSRMLRIYPQYAVVLLLSIAISVYAWLTENRHPIAVYKNFPLSDVGDFFVYFTQISLIGLENILFFARDANGGISFTSNFAMANQPPLHYYVFVPQAWSLGLELMFYVMVPFVLSRIYVSIIIIVSSFALRIFFWQEGYTHDPWTYRFFPFEIALFLCASMSFILWQLISERMRSQLSSSRFFLISVALLASTIVFFNSLRETFGEGAYWGCYLLAFLLLPILFNGTRKSNIDRFIGDLSYPIYISHLFVIWVLYFVFKLSLDNIVYATIFVTIIFSLLLNSGQSRIDAFRHIMVKPLNGSGNV